MSTPMTQDEQRRRRRRALYLVGLLPSLLLLLLSGRILLALHDESAGLAAYDAGRFDEARRHFAANRVLNPIEPWIAPFDEGDARYRLADFAGAVAAFEAALQRVPDRYECLVRVNLALAHEAVGDKALKSGDRQAATDAWEEGKAALAECPQPLSKQDLPVDEQPSPTHKPSRPAGEQPPRKHRPPPGKAQHLPPDPQAVHAEAVRVDRRLDRKLGVGPDVTPPPPETPPAEDERTKEKERQLQERNQQAHADNVQHRKDFDPQPPSPPPPPTPQW